MKFQKVTVIPDNLIDLPVENIGEIVQVAIAASNCSTVEEIERWLFVRNIIIPKVKIILFMTILRNEKAPRTVSVKTKQESFSMETILQEYSDFPRHVVTNNLNRIVGWFNNQGMPITRSTVTKLLREALFRRDAKSQANGYSEEVCSLCNGKGQYTKFEFGEENNVVCVCSSLP